MNDRNTEPHDPTDPTGPEEVGPEAVGPEDIGSVGEEALRLFRALSASSRTTGSDDVPNPDAAPHACPTGWCPICQVAAVVRDNPEVVERVTASAGSLLTALRDLVTAATTPKERP